MSRLEIIEANLDRADQAQIILDLTNAYALDPIGGVEEKEVFTRVGI